MLCLAVELQGRVKKALHRLDMNLSRSVFISSSPGPVCTISIRCVSVCVCVCVCVCVWLLLESLVEPFDWIAYAQ